MACFSLRASLKSYYLGCGADADVRLALAAAAADYVVVFIHGISNFIIGGIHF